MPPKNSKKKKEKKSQTKYELQKLRRKKPVPDYVFKFRKPSRRIGSGGVLKKSNALGRLMRWPKYVKLQRQRKILLQRLKIPPALNIFNNACSKDFAAKLVKFGKNYSPESSKQKQNRLRATAKLQEQGQAIPSGKKNVIKYGFNNVTNLIESGKAKLVIIAHGMLLLLLFIIFVCSQQMILILINNNAILR